MNITTRFTLDDLERANAAWKCNCGPGALAAILGMTLDEVRPHMVGFEEKGYMNPTMMFAALRSAIGDVGERWRVLPGSRSLDGVSSWPGYGLARVQWEGDWTRPGVPMRARYRYTHWIGAATGGDGARGVFDINALANGSGWCAIKDWTEHVVPVLVELYKGATGGWHITHAIEVERVARRAVRRRRRHVNRRTPNNVCWPPPR
jgi:hypothetical protein